MNLPDKIIIDGVPVKILYFDNFNDVDKYGEGRLRGQCVFKDFTIRIFRGNNPMGAIWRTIWHEVFHYVLEGFPGEFKEAEEEAMVDHLGSQINKIMIDNGFMETPTWGPWTIKEADFPDHTETLPGDKP